MISLAFRRTHSGRQECWTDETCPGQPLPLHMGTRLSGVCSGVVAWLLLLEEYACSGLFVSSGLVIQACLLQAASCWGHVETSLWPLCSSQGFARDRLPSRALGLRSWESQIWL